MIKNIKLPNYVSRKLKKIKRAKYECRTNSSVKHFKVMIYKLEQPISAIVIK